MMIATQKWLCVPLRIRPSVSTCFEFLEKRAASKFPVDCVGCLVSYSPILHVGLQEEDRKNLSGLVSAWETTYLHERLETFTVATREKERRASLRFAPPRARPCVRVVD